MNIKKFFLWYFMLTKRIFHKFSFIILLCSIPLMVLATDAAMSEESGVVKILLYSEEGNSGAEEIINSLLADDSVILFQRCGSMEYALNEAEQQRADAVWCFADDFEEKTEKFASGKSREYLVYVYEREESVFLQLSREKLYSAIYNKFSYMVYKSFVYTELVDVNRVSEERVKSYYDSMGQGSDVIELESVDTQRQTGENSYLTAPLRGILSVLIMLCGFAAAMYFLKDRANGKFDWMSAEERIVPAFVQCLAAIIPAAAVVFVTVCFTDAYVGFIDELISMLLFVLSSSGFCLLMCTVFRSFGKLGAVTPPLVIAMMVLSPVFFDLSALRMLSLVMPTYYYLNSVYNAEYHFYSVIYIICLYIIILILNSGLKNRKSII